MRVEVHRDAINDLFKIKMLNAPVAARLGALIDELRTDPKFANRLLSSGDDRNISVLTWHSLKHQLHGLPVYRMKFLCLEQHGIKYRIIYAYHYPSQTIPILAVVARPVMDYDSKSDPIRLRIINTIEEEYPGG